MKIRYQAGILAAALSLSVMSMAFAAGSSSTRPRPIGGGSYNQGGPGITTIEDGGTPLLPAEAGQCPETRIPELA